MTHTQFDIKQGVFPKYSNKLNNQDIVSVYACDGKEYFGRVISFVPEQRFIMRWLAPDVEKFRSAIEKNIPLSETDFKHGGISNSDSVLIRLLSDCLIHETVESITCIKSVIDRTGTMLNCEFPVVDETKSDLSRFVNVSTERTNQSVHLALVCQNPQVSIEDFIQVVRNPPL